MDFDFPEEAQAARKKAREFALREFTPAITKESDELETFRDEIRKKMFAENIIDVNSPWSLVVAIEETCRVDPGNAIASTASMFGAEILMLFGSEEQKEKFLLPTQRGEKIMGLAVTEPGGGSDVAGLKTKAERRGDKLILNGSKMFITNGTTADFYLMLVRTSTPDEKKHHGLSVVIVEANTPGFTRNKLVGKLGVRATSTAELILDNVEIPADRIVGEEGKGFYYVMTFFNISRVYVAAQSIGIAQGCMDRTLEYLKTLKGKEKKEILEDTQFSVVDVATRIEASRLLTYKAASYLFQFKPNPALTSMAKSYASETAVIAAQKALEITSAYGMNSDIERFFRDSKIMEIWEGTSEIEKLIIYRSMEKSLEGEVN
ncbi:MAG: acyl-CoA/acyl-ACP dehydrogenase [Candidatus Thermoplasmatota archaeon]|nr:acyl-CoA/acyl-ACP dehydrogenase [Candidatus Thermoplasmatota archaeon]